MSDTYVKDYSKVLAGVPAWLATRLVELGYVDGFEVLGHRGLHGHLFRDDLLYVVDIPERDIPLAMASIEYTREGYPTLYCGMRPEDAHSHFEDMVLPILVARISNAGG